MSLSREIPISVHPEFRVRATCENQGKPRILTQSSSLPCGQRIELVAETSNSSKDGDEETSTAENVQNTAELPIECLNVQNRDENKEFTEFWKTGLPDHPNGQNFKEGIPSKLHVREEKEERRHFFTENPFVEDLVRVFEDHYTSGPSHPVKLGRRNTYSAESLGESHLAPKLTRRNSDGFHRNETSFIIPIKVEFDDRDDGNRKEGNNFSESVLQGDCVIHGEGTIKPDLKADSVQIKTEKDQEIVDDGLDGSSKGYEKDEDCVLEDPKENSIETDRYLNHEEANTDQGRLTDAPKPNPSQSPLLQPQQTEVKNDENRKKLLKIQSILNKANELEKEVDAFSDKNKTKEYLILEEVLTCCLIELDAIETNRDENIRLARKKGVQLLQRTLTRLERKITSSDADENEKGVRQS